MYTVDGRDRVAELDSLPQSSVGAPLPVVVCDEHATLIAYIVSQHDSNWDGTRSRTVGSDSEDEPIAIVQFLRPRAVMFGPPNDEAFDGHPLASRGLEPYGSFEVVESSWIRCLERMNSVHRGHRPEFFAGLHHYVLSFHDSTFECVAEDVQLIEIVRGSMRQAGVRMAEMLAARGG